MSDNHNHTQDDQELGWFERVENHRLLILLTVLICVGFGAADFFYHKHPHFSAEEIPVFYGLFGFAAFFFVVLAGAQLRKLIMRPEDYYDDQEEAQDAE